MESTTQKIIRKTGRKPIDCKCSLCKQQCKQVCLGTPDDIMKIADAGYGNLLKYTDWWAGVSHGVSPIRMVQLELTNNGCVCFVNGLCILHDKGLKPTEGKLSHHSTTMDNFKFRKSLSWNVAKEWIAIENKELVQEILNAF